MKVDAEGFEYPSVDKTSCINCGLCEKVCPINKQEPLRSNKPNTYAAKIKDDTIRNLSSSGGIFSILANEILSKCGVVYGVALSDDLKQAQHIRVDNTEDIYKLRGSKYLQSKTGNIFNQVKSDLEDNKQVLFSGVPCQINGLKLFLRKEYENLLTVEVICHGVPSPALWLKYFDYLETKYNAKIQKVNFREKRNGWKTFGLTEDGDNISQYLNLHHDPYMQMFLRNYCLRPSCYDCVAKKLESMADLTIADFWGIQNVAPEMDDDKGTSLVLVQTKKGEKILDSLKEQFVSKKVDFDDGIKSNISYWKSCDKPNERNYFFDDMNTMSFSDLQAKYCKPIRRSLIKRGIGKAKLILKHILRGVEHSNTSTQFEYGLLIQMTRDSE
ncbi:MAG: Coenzyme F420 hydrogenase/dehydrogenase, beta subunit C-terminal domain [Clostridia bacterium]|nr:Coenzyme F420 hydrogenase/dehydrogenase, beta subunit C-terminal domain [Clostridia bacterium]